MKYKKTINRLEDIITQELGHNDWQFNQDFKDDLGLDSLEFILLIAEVEEQFNLERINEFQLENITTPEKLLNYIVSR